MKLASYSADGRRLFGALVDGALVTMNGRLPAHCDTLRAALVAGAIDSMREIAAREKPDLALADVQLLPLIPEGAQFFAAGVNYRAHVEETGKKVRTLDDGPAFFLRLPSSLAGHDQALIRPRVSTHFDFEGELAVVIGRAGRHIAEADALGHVAGYTCFMDGSIRDYQKHSVSIGKNFAATGPLGPWLVTADEIADPTALTLTTRLNGDIVQHSGLDQLIFSIPFLIAYLSRITVLQPGDVIATGTPGGIGRERTPPLWMRAGDRIEVDISGVGVLSNPIVDEDQPAAASSLSHLSE